VYVNSSPHITEVDERTNPIFPHEARLRNLTYSTEIFCDVQLVKVELESESEMKRDGRKTQKIKRIEKDSPVQKIVLGKCPVMVRSNFCHLTNFSDSERVKDAKECVYDQGGYFVINGSEKVIVAQERMATNIVLVFHKKPPSKYSWISEIRSQGENSMKPPQQFTVCLKSKQRPQNQMTGAYGQKIMATIPHIREPIPVCILFRALGCTSDLQIFQMVCQDKNDTAMYEAMRPSIEEAMEGQILTEEEALVFMARRGSAAQYNRKKQIEWASMILESEFLPHVSTSAEGILKKAYFVGYMVSRLIQASLGRTGEDDRDYYGKKRLDMAGALLTGLFRQLYRNLQEECARLLRKALDYSKRELKISDLIKPDIITNGLRYGLSTGNWGKDKQGDVQKTGVSQVLNRLTFSSSLSHLRRLNTPLSKQGKLTKPRQLHNSHWGMVCPAETPEGQACGLVKNLSLMTFVSVGANAKMI